MNEQTTEQLLAEARQQTEWYRSRCEALRMDNQNLRLRLESVELDYLRSASWKLTKPVRSLSAMLHRQPQLNIQDVSLLAVPPQSHERDPELQKLIDAHGEDSKPPVMTLILTDIYGSEGFDAAADSLLKQEWSSVEILAAVSGDRVPSGVLSRSGIRLIREKDSLSALNTAIREARGDYLLFQTANSVSHPDRAALSFAELENGSDVLWCGSDSAALSSCAMRVGPARRVGGLKPELGNRAVPEFFLRLKNCGYVLHRMDRSLTDGSPSVPPVHDNPEDESLLLPVHRPKIAYVIPGCGISGGIAVVCHHAARLEKRGYEVLLLTESGERSITWFPRLHIPVMAYEDAPGDIDIIVATSWSTAFTAIHYPRGRKCYFVQSNEIRFFPQDSPQAYLARLSYSLPYIYLTEAHWIRDWLKERYGQDAVYVPNGIDETLMYRCDSYTRSDGRLRVLLEGSISSPFKGMKDAFAAVDGLDCEVWCVSVSGEPEPGWHCDRLIRRAALHEMKYIYSSCDILLKMSRVEGFFGPPMEMMACGGACVVGKVTGYDEYIADGENALVVETGDVEGARKALQRLLTDPELREKLIRNGRKTAAEWGWDRSIDILGDLYTGLWQEMEAIRTGYTSCLSDR